MNRQLIRQGRAVVRAALVVSVLAAFVGSAGAQGVRFQEVRPPDIELSFSAISFADAATGMLIGERVLEDEKSAVFVTSDGCKTFTSDLGTLRGRLLAGTFVDPKNGWIVGEQGAVMATTDGGATWNVQTSKALTDLYAVSFVSPQIGWAVGQNSTVVKTTNGGRTWRVLSGGQPSGEVGEGAVMYMGCDFINEQTGFAAGAGETGMIVKTSDGGTTWTNVYEAPDNLQTIVFSDSMNGWAGGKYGLFLVTTDGGATWEQVDAGTEEDIFSIAVGDSGHMWLSGDYGTIGYSTDMGQTWVLVGVQVEIFGSMKDLIRPVTGVAAIGNRAWAVTNAGRVLHFMLD